MFNNADEVLRYVKDGDVNSHRRPLSVTCRASCSTSMCAGGESVDDSFFTEGQMFDGSSIRGFRRSTNRT